MTFSHMAMDRPLRILILEDTPTDAELAQRELRKAAMVFVAECVETRETFLKALDTWQPDIVLADYKLPHFDGLTALELLRQRSPDLPFVFVSGTMGEEFAIETLHRGASDYVLKGHLSKLGPAVVRALKVAETQYRHRLAEQDLFKSRQMLRTVLDTVPQRVFWKDLASIYLGCNQPFAIDYGFASPADLIGKTDFDLVSFELARRWRAEDQQIMANGQPHLDIEESYTKADGGQGWRVLCKAPLRDQQGQVTAILCTYEDITARKASEARARYLVYHDGLTELPNHLLASDRLQQAMAYADRESSKVALLFLDLDNFKTINDSLGHTVGDKLLCEVATRLGQCVRDTDTVSRQGGDEFLIVVPALHDSDASAPVLDKLLQSIHLPMVIDGHELSTSVSIGIAVYPDDGQDFESLMKKADTAMYQAKDAGGNTYCFFDKQMNDDVLENLRMRSGLGHALERDEFVLHYQPQIDLNSGALVGVEALIRWQHPTLGLVPPARFIPVAEETTMIVEIGEWVMMQACRQVAIWHRAGYSKISIAVNLSAIQFQRGDLEDTVKRALAQSGLEPSLLELELTESILIRNTENILTTVRQLKQLGVMLSIDDFGTGYSSLSYLKRFNVDKLKIDQSFIRHLATDPNDAAIVRAVVQMAHSLGLRTIAEGVEDESLLNDLRAFHCDEAQGYYFARPMPAQEMTQFLIAAQTSRL
ncbi:bifunctional diguanylate cyclase/phosphodiesterase [Rhodoferax sp.]|uniref:putative bifunctional diguanylate cyclase/phosphodiesterase n=1 Tax=Rhodoferax sp. TaxID=50421 RepID=UPI002728BBEF|nr:EAL domain-containing protein [Rhodoferax sp.]MDO8319974.1 EAL domain-containing protein [Rhodoferax sp.]